jgi:hypothetical protein
METLQTSTTFGLGPVASLVIHRRICLPPIDQRSDWLWTKRNGSRDRGHGLGLFAAWPFFAGSCFAASSLTCAENPPAATMLK